jgi:hypothetical protein
MVRFLSGTKARISLYGISFNRLFQSCTSFLVLLTATNYEDSILQQRVAGELFIIVAWKTDNHFIYLSNAMFSVLLSPPPSRTELMPSLIKVTGEVVKEEVMPSLIKVIEEDAKEEVIPSLIIRVIEEDMKEEVMPSLIKVIEEVKEVEETGYVLLFLCNQIAYDFILILII